MARPGRIGDPEAAQLAQRYYTLFVRAGARLGGAEQERLRNLNQRMAELNTRFEQNARKATNEGRSWSTTARRWTVCRPSRSARPNRPPGPRTGRQVGDRAAEHDDPAVLAQLKSRALRERIYRASIGRADVATPTTPP